MSRAVAVRPPALPAPRAAVTRYPDSYAPGPIREATDRERSTILAFIHAHPEYARLSHDEIVQAMSTYRTDDQAASRDRVEGEGVPWNWRAEADEDEHVGEIDDPLARV